MIDFNRYFLHDHQIFLDNINYETVKAGVAEPGVKLNCKDTIVAQLNEKTGIKITFNRTLSFEPERLFFLSVTFGVTMRFNPVYADEIEWRDVDIAGEFKKNCPQILTNLMSRTSMLISEITSAAGQPPIVTPGGVAPVKRSEA